MDVNVFTITGRAVKDATVRTVASGSKVLSVDVAVNTGYGDYEKTLFVKLQQWGDNVDKIASYIAKGQTIAASGELSRNEWGDPKRVDFILTTRAITLIGPKRDKSSDSSYENATIDSNDDAIVF